MPARRQERGADGGGRRPGSRNLSSAPRIGGPQSGAPNARSGPCNSNAAERAGSGLVRRGRGQRARVGRCFSAVALLSVALLDNSTETAARGRASSVPQARPAVRSGDGAAAGRRLLGISLRTQLSEDGDGMTRAGKALEKIIHQRDIEMQKRALYVEKKMHDMVTKPWATVHPLKLKRDERRDEALVRQAKRQVKADQRLLKEAMSVSEHDKKLLTVAAARKSLQIDGEADEHAHRRDAAMAHLATKQNHAHSAALHPALHALSHAYKGAGGSETQKAANSAQWTESRISPVHYVDAAKGPTSSGSPHSSSAGESSSSSALAGELEAARIALSAQLRNGDETHHASMSARFETVRHKSLALARLGEKHNEIYTNAADENAHHAVESLPYMLPPLGCVTASNSEKSSL